MVDSCLREADFLSGEIARIDREIARYALGCPEIRRLMTIPGVSLTTAATLMPTIGRIDRFPSARHLVGYKDHEREPAPPPIPLAILALAVPPAALCLYSVAGSPQPQ